MPDHVAPLVVVAEKDEAKRQSIVQTLRKAGYAATEVKTGADALREATSGPAAMVVCARLPDMDGSEACRQLKSDPATAAVPILLIDKSHGDSPGKRTARAGSADICLTEVQEPEALVSTIGALVRMRRAEEAAQASTRAWQATFDAIPDGIFLLDRAGRVIRCNAALAELMGRTVSDLVGRPAEELHRALPAAAVPFTECLATRRRASADMAIAGWWFRLTADPVITLGGELAGAVGILSNITEQRRSEAARRASDEQFRALVESVRDYAIFRTDSEGRATTWNEGVRRVLGFSEAEFIGNDIRGLFAPEDKAAGVPDREMREAARHGSASDDRWMLRKDRTRFFASGTTSAVRDEASVLLGFTKIMRDATESKRSEDALKIADRRKDEFLAMLGHELRNPLAPIRNALFLMRLRGMQDLGDVERLRAMMDRQIAHLSRLVDDLLDVSRITQGTFELRAEPMDLRDAIVNAADAIRPFANERGIDLDVALPAEALPVNADMVRLEQVFTNLLHNAAKYTYPGGRIAISAQEEKKQESIEITVRDTGMGIRPELVDRIFDKFSQGDPIVGRLKEGLGLGLALVKTLVEMHGGTVSAASEGPGRGSEFTVRLPAIAETTGANGRECKPEQHAPSAPESPRKVLVVDDNRGAADSLGMVLEAHGDIVRVAYEGESALKIAGEFQPQAALLDLGLPKGLDGYQLARRLHQVPGLQGIPIIALTGHGRVEDRKRSAAAGFIAHLVKPVDPKELRKLLEQSS
jgi:PAS domain S-box-containing protein